MEESSETPQEERRELRLKSVAGAPDMVYPWPLTVGKGKIDEKNHDLFLILIHVMLQEV